MDRLLSNLVHETQYYSHLCILAVVERLEMILLPAIGEKLY